MGHGFPDEFLAEMKPVALARIKGGIFRRMFLGGLFSHLYDSWRYLRGRGYVTLNRRDRGQRFSRAAYFTAVHEAAQRMTPRDRSAWREDGTLPAWFWDWVDARAASWDSLPS